MAWKNMQITCWLVFFIIGCFLWSKHLFAAEEEDAKKKTTEKPSIIFKNNIAANGAPFSAEETPGRTRFDFDSLTTLMAT